MHQNERGETAESPAVFSLLLSLQRPKPPKIQMSLDLTHLRRLADVWLGSQKKCSLRSAVRPSARKPPRVRVSPGADWPSRAKSGRERRDRSRQVFSAKIWWLRPAATGRSPPGTEHGSRNSQKQLTLVTQGNRERKDRPPFPRYRENRFHNARAVSRRADPTSAMFPAAISQTGRRPPTARLGQPRCIRGLRLHLPRVRAYLGMVSQPK